MPDLSPQALSPFLRGSSLVFDHTTRTEVTGTIDAGPDHHTPWGVVHGGLYATAVESTTSVGASLAVADQGMFAVGLSNQTDFIRAHTLGRLHVKAWPIHQGRTGQLWQCDITRQDGKLVAQGRVRLQNVPMPSAGACSAQRRAFASQTTTFLKASIRREGSLSRPARPGPDRGMG